MPTLDNFNKFRAERGSPPLSQKKYEAAVRPPPIEDPAKEPEETPKKKGK